MTEVQVEFVDGNRKHKLASVKGYLFERNKEIVNGVSYRCLEFNKTKCPAILHVLDSGSFFHKDHTHPPSPDKIVARKIISKAKAEVRHNPLLRTGQVMTLIEREVTETGVNAVALGKTINLKRRICDARIRVQGRRDLGDNFENLQIPPELAKTLNGDNFLLYDNHDNNRRIIIFSSRANLDKLSYCRTWLVDDTFKSRPQLFQQLYTIHGIYCDIQAVPLVYAYLPSKSEETYTEFFNAVRRYIQGEPEIIISDFEIAAINACRTVFPATEFQGCLFHLTQSIFRKISSIPWILQRYMGHDQEANKVRTALRSLGALAFMRPNEVEGAFRELRNQFRHDDEIRQVFAYFDNTYIGYTWDEALFPIPFWTVRARFEAGVPRTNNSAEGWHYRFNEQHHRSRPSVSTSVQMLRSEQNHWEQECEKIRGGLRNGKKKQYRQIEMRLRNIIQSQEAQAYHSHSEFLAAVQYCLHEFIVDNNAPGAHNQ